MRNGLKYTGLGLAVLSVLMALFNEFELVPHAESMAHLKFEPFNSKWQNAVDFCILFARITLIVSLLSTLFNLVLSLRLKSMVCYVASALSLITAIMAYAQIN